MFVQSISMFGKMACSLFAMISGFFLIEKERVNPAKIAMILVDVAFFTALIAVITWTTGLVPITLGSLLRSGLNWYVIYYVIFCFFVPYVNRMLRALERDVFGKLMLAIFVFWSVLPTLTFRQIDYSEMDFFIVMYITGAFIRLHVYGKTNYKNIRNLWIALGAAALMVL